MYLLLSAWMSGLTQLPHIQVQHYNGALPLLLSGLTILLLRPQPVGHVVAGDADALIQSTLINHMRFVPVNNVQLERLSDQQVSLVCDW